MKKALIITITSIFVGGIILSSILIASHEETFIDPKQTQPVANFRVAFIADQGLGANAVSVLKLIKDEGAHMVLHQGDFDYVDDPHKWDKQISDVLGSDFPYFASIGNHDIKKWGLVIPVPNPFPDIVFGWGGYQEKLYDRLKKNPDANCIGDLGVKSSCTYQGLLFILSAPGLKNSEYDSFIEKQLGDNDFIWKICSWHLNMSAMQVGKKQNQTGWEVYEACKNNGAIIVTGHEHSYSRTKTLIDFENQIVDPEWSEPNKLRVKEGATFAAVSGLGGLSIRSQEQCFPDSSQSACSEIWASIYTANQDANYGALFCTFNVEGKPNKAYCYFKNIDGKIIDEFSITSFVGKPTL
uniref:Calcineurin-like phosphoesterase domain-containing protein n=1 Tax=uncultured marine thaumarchaeote KM3_136_A11 TaxID=1456004 RepID=A0A075GB91_9ARCH|nr:hypothetical protein [uncultured marine thaumarchaeote KM3_136_A11]